MKIGIRFFGGGEAKSHAERLENRKRKVVPRNIRNLREVMNHAKKKI